MKKAILFLEDGSCFWGKPLDVEGDTCGEVVFNTAMTGYQEILTDPSYAGQIVVMTYPLIGNYGVNEEDVESFRVHVKGFVVKEFCRYPSNYRASKSLIDYLNENNIIAIEGIDTRALTRKLRIYGAMKGIISTSDFDKDSLSKKLEKIPSMEGSDWVKEVTVEEPYIWDKGLDRSFYLPLSRAGGITKKTGLGKKLAVIDCGVKYNILRIFKEKGCDVEVFPATTEAREILASNPDGVFISNGPGDPAAVTYVVDTVRAILGRVPVFGICLGHQIICLALGAKTYKLKFGHHGGNHPVKDLLDNRIGITSQNHGFCVDESSLNKEDVELININLNDQTLEGIRHKKMPVISFQYHPEAAPGPHDAGYLFDCFIEMMEKNI